MFHLSHLNSLRGERPERTLPLGMEKCSGWRMHLRAAMEGGKNLLAISFVLIFFFMTREKFSMFASQLRADSNGFRRQASCSAGNCDWVSLSGPSGRSEPCMQILMACLCEFAAAALRRQC